MLRSSVTGIIVAVGLGVSVIDLRAQDSTSALLAAKPVDGVLVLRLLDESGQKITKTSFEFRTPQDPFRPLVPGRVFRSNDAIRIEYQQPNPFVLQIAVSETQAEDPNAAQLAKFVDKLLTFPTVVGAAQSASRSACSVLEDVYRRLRLLRSALRVGSTNAEELAKWRKAVDDAPGRPGILAARRMVDERLAFVRTAIEQAKDELRYFETLLSGQGVVVTPAVRNLARLDGRFPPTPGEVLTRNRPLAIMFASRQAKVPATTGTGATTQTKPVGQGGAANDAAAKEAAAKQAAAAKEADAKKEAEAIKAKEAEAAACSSPTELARALVTIVDIGSAREGLKNLELLAESLIGINRALEPYASASRWSGENYLIHVVDPTPEQVKTVNVSATELKYQSSPTGVLVQVAGTASSTKFDVRQGGTFVPELGAGMIVTKILSPDYGTTTNSAGQLVVAQPVKKSVSYSGALVLNAVCRCGIGASFLHPVIQFGVATDGSSPGLLIGAGARFARPKRLALTGGVVVAWIKDLDSLKVGSPIKGSADIKSDLKFRNEARPYLGLIYTF